MLRFGYEPLDLHARLRIEASLGHSLQECYQCGKCSAGCPSAFTMSAPPNRVIRYLQLGQYDAALAQNSYWVCSSCETCTTRCPRGVEIKEVMEVLRHDAFRRRRYGSQRRVAIFHHVFLLTVRLFGRLYEPALIMLNNVASGAFFKDILNAPAMLAKGKLKLLPGPGPDLGAIRRIYREAREVANRAEI